MAMVETIKLHILNGILRKPGDVYSTEDKLVFNAGYVRMAPANSAPVVNRQQLVEEVAGAEESIPDLSEKPAKRNYRRRDMTAESSQSKAI